MQVRAVSYRQRDRPVVVKTTIGNARERYDAMCKGKPVPPKPAVKQELPKEFIDCLLDEAAKMLAERYKKDVEEGRI